MRAVICFILLSLIAVFIPLISKESTYLKNNLESAKTGDYVVALRDKSYALLYVENRSETSLFLGEVTVPTTRFPKGAVNWKLWLSQGCPGSTSWLFYEIDLGSGYLVNMYAMSNGKWNLIAQQDRFLSTLLNLRLSYIPPQQRKQVGPSIGPNGTESKRVWTPTMVMDGKVVRNVAFDAWKTKWPNDGTEMAGKSIEIYVPEDHQKYPSYFPYWLQVTGMVGKAKIFIVDSGITDL